MKAGADVSITIRMDPAIKRAIAGIADHAWEGIAYPNAIFDETSGTWVSNAEVAEVPYTAFTSKPKAKQVPEKLAVRRIPELNPRKKAAGQDPLFDLWRYHAFSRHHLGRGFRYGDRRQGPPGPCGDRERPRRCEELRPGTHALREIHRQRRLDRAGRDRVQSHPSRGHPHRRSRSHPRHNRHDPTHAGARPRPRRLPLPAHTLTPSHPLALAAPVGTVLFRSPRP